MDIYGKATTFTGDKTFIPFRYQGQYEDDETGLYYNRFRYYSPDSGTYISQDPIGLQGGLNQYAYVHDTNDWVDVFGLAPWPNGGFAEWWDNPKTSVQDVLDNQDSVESAMRRMNGGSNHEMFPVSEAGKAKELGFTHAELEERTVKTKNTSFSNVPDKYGNLHSGPHSTGKKLPKGQSGKASSWFHIDLIQRLKGAKTKRGAKSIITRLHNKYMNH